MNYQLVRVVRVGPDGTRAVIWENAERQRAERLLNLAYYGFGYEHLAIEIMPLSDERCETEVARR